MTLNFEKLKRDNERIQAAGNNTRNSFFDNFVKMPEKSGALIVRFLEPAAPGMFDREENDLYCTTRTHKINDRNYHCPRELGINPRTKNEQWLGECPICSYYSWLWDESEKKSDKHEKEALQEKARALKPTIRHYYNVIVREQIGPNGEVEKDVGPKILAVGITLQKIILTGMFGDKVMKEDGYGDITHHTTGRDFKIIKGINGRDTYATYTSSKFLEPSPLGTPDNIEKWLSNLHDLQALRQVQPVEELKKQLKIHLGLLPDTTDTSFDISEFQKPSVAEVTKVSVSVPAHVPAASSVASNNDDEPLVDEDFIKQMQDMQ